MQRELKLTTTLILPAATILALATGCVTRTVYVVDDRDRAPQVVQRDPEPQVEVQASGGGGGVVAYESDAGITDDSDFYEPLSPYGTWIAYPGYGRVWQPSVTVVGSRFRPYTHGHWEHTEWGWTWVDHHPFGWATGHYGRWLYDSNYGWVWTPGTQWSPAWVTWRTGGGYVGWAAMPPGSVYGGGYSVYDTSWVFVSNGSMGVAYVGGVIVTGSAYRSCYYQTRDYRSTYVVYGRSYYRGPDYDEVRRSGQVIHRPLAEVDRERPVSRPPQGTVLARGRDRGRDPTRGGDRGGDEDRGGTGRPRDDDRNGGGGSGGGGGGGGTGRDRDDTNGRDNGIGGGRDNGGGGNGGGRDGSGVARGDDDDNNGTGRDRDDNGTGRGRDDNGTGRDNNGGRGNGSNGRDVVIPQSGNLVNDRRDDVGGPVTRPVDTGRDDDGTGVGRDGNDRDDDRSPIGGGRGDDLRDDDRVPSRPVNGRDDVGNGNTGGNRGSVRMPPETPPKKSYVDDPARFRENTRVDRPTTSGPGRPIAERPSASDRSPARVTPPSRSAPRPSVDRAPSRPAEVSTPTPSKKKDTKKSTPSSTSKKRR